MYSCELTVRRTGRCRSATVTSEHQVLRSRMSKPLPRCWGRTKRPVTLVTRLWAKPTGEGGGGARGFRNEDHCRARILLTSAA